VAIFLFWLINGGSGIFGEPGYDPYYQATRITTVVFSLFEK
jgi:hypothetical protein